MKRIAVVTPIFPPLRGGIGTVAESDAQIFSELEHTVSVYVPEYQKGIYNKKYDGNIFINVLKPFFKYRFAAVVPQIIKALWQNDVVVLNYPFFGGAEFLALWPRFKKKLILVYHMDVLGTGPLAWWMKFYKPLILPLILKRADKIVVSSTDYIQNSMVKDVFLKLKDRIVAMPFMVDGNKFRPVLNDNEKTELRTIFKLPQSAKLILMVGGMDSQHYFKGVDVALKAMVGINNHVLVLVGDGNLKTGFEIIAEDLKISERVIFLGNISDDDLPKIYRACDVFMFPSVDRSEAFGLVLLEAMASGLPVLVSDLPGVRTVVRDQVNGFLFLTKNISQLQVLVNNLLANDEKLSEFSQKSRQIVEVEYSGDVRKKQWQSLIGSL